MKTEAVTYKQWDSYAKKIERKNLKESGESLTFSSIAQKASNYIVESQPDNKIIIAKKGWREAMKRKEQI